MGLKPLDPHRIPRSFRNEETHTRRVTEHALRLFDGTKPAFGLTSRERDLLEAAGRLHDVGYASNPLDHVKASAVLVLERGVRGFSKSEAHVIAAVILLHRKNLAKALAHPIVARAPERARVLKLAAILRVGDGLDHGHVQDLRILGVDARPRAVVVSVVSPGYAGNVPWARSKADLWARVFRRPLRFRVEKARAKKNPYDGIARKGDTLLGAMRRCFYLNFRTLGENHEAALRGAFETPVHDMRVAARRFRTALRILPKKLAGTAAPAIAQDLRAFLDHLSSARDADVCFRILRELGCPTAARKLSTARSSARAALSAYLSSGECIALLRRMAWLVRVELPAMVGSSRDGKLAPFARRRLCKAGARMRKRNALAMRLDSASLHDVRRAVRRERYTAEFFADSSARVFKRVADLLGSIHDLDLVLEHLGSANATVTARVLRRRTALVRKFRERWAEMVGS